MTSEQDDLFTFNQEPLMIRTITDKKNIPTRIAEVLDMDHPRWLEKVLLLVGFYTSPKRAIRTLKVAGARKARSKARKQKAAPARKSAKAARTLIPSMA
jgi:hypothetical protein